MCVCSLLQVGDSYIAHYGTASNPLFAVAIIELDCGFFAYQPLVQWRVHRLQCLVCAKTNVALSLASGLAKDPTQEDVSQELRKNLEDRCDQIGLNSAIRALRKELASLLTAYQSLANIPVSSRSTEDALADFDRHGAIMRQIRSRCMLTCFVQRRFH